METFFKFIDRPVILDCITGVFSLLTFFLLGIYFELGKSDWASWVQAVGSICALAVAIFVMSRQNAHAARLVVQADLTAFRRRSNAVFAVMKSSHERVTECFQQILKDAGSNDRGEFHSTMLSIKPITDELQGRLAAIPLHDLGDIDMADSILSFQEIVRILGFMNDAWSMEPDMRRIANVIPELQSKLNDSLEKFEDGMAQFSLQI